MIKSSLDIPSLKNYVTSQLNYFFPDNRALSISKKALILTLDRLEIIIYHVKMWNSGYFNHLNSSQYCAFLYLLSNFIYKEYGECSTCEKIFYLNKALNGIDLYYKVNLPNIFFFPHTSGTVIANTNYGDRLIIFQNCTVGRYGSNYPSLADNIIMFPGSSIIGSCKIGNNVTISPSVTLLNQTIESNTIVINESIYDSTIRDKMYTEYYFN